MKNLGSGPDPEKNGKLFQLLFWLFTFVRAPWFVNPARKGSDMFLHTLEYALLNLCKQYGLSVEAAYWFGLALQITLWILLAGWIVRSVFEVLDDMKEMLNRLRTANKTGINTSISQPVEDKTSDRVEPATPTPTGLGVNVSIATDAQRRVSQPAGWRR